MNRLSIQERARILHCLVEGNSMRATSRMCDVSINTVTKLLREVGFACLKYQDGAMRNISCRSVQCDEIWSFCYAKQKNVPKDHEGEFGYGDVYTWVAIDADTKLVPAFMVGRRSYNDARWFIHDLSQRLKHRVQLTTDGYRAYVSAVAQAFDGDVDYAMLVKLYGTPDDKDERRYSPGECCGTTTQRISGNPNETDISTSFVERQNLTMRMCMRRFTRLTNGFSKKIQNLEFAVGLHFMFYNFARIHKSLRVTPAMEAGISDHVWSLEEIAALADIKNP